MNKILILEDDRKLNDGIRLLRGRLYFSVPDHRSFWELLKKEKVPDSSGSNLPDGNGLDFLQEIRAKSAVPVIIITANNMETDIVMGLELGANDYITKPFSLMVLRARAGVQLRQQDMSGQTLYQEGPFSFDFQRLVFQVRGREVEFSKTEQRLLILTFI